MQIYASKSKFKLTFNYLNATSDGSFKMKLGQLIGDDE